MSSRFLNSYLKTINRLSISKPFLIFWILFFILVSYVFSERLESYNKYSIYIFEWLFAFLSLALFWPEFKIKFTLESLQIRHSLLSLLAGAFVYYLGKVVIPIVFAGNQIQIIIPYDFSTLDSLFMLIIIGPLIEELIFRFSLWHTISKLVKNNSILIIITSALFSFAHYYSIFLVPSDLFPFIYFQTLYTFLIGLWWGYVYLKTKSFYTPLCLHVIFNLGFYLGYRIFN